MVDLDYTFFIQLGLFISLALLLKFILFDPYLSNLKRREEILYGYRKEAEEIRLKIDDLSRRFDEKIKAMREEARKDYEDIKNEGNNERDRILSEAKNSVSKIIEEGREHLMQEKENIMKDALRHIDEIANQISERILKGNKGR